MLRNTPDRGYAYVILATSFLGHFMMFGITYSMGVFYNEFRETFHDTTGSIALISSLNTALLYGFSSVSSILTNRYGPQAVCFLGGLLAGCAFALSVFAPNIYTLYILFGALSGVGFGLSYIPLVTILAGYFVKRRSLAVGIAVSGGGIGNLVFPPITQYLILVYGWQGTCLLLGGVSLNLCVLGLLLKPIDLSSDVIEVCQNGDLPENKAASKSIAMEHGNVHSLGDIYILKQKSTFDVAGSIISLHSVGRSCEQLNLMNKNMKGNKLDTNETKIEKQNKSIFNFFILKNVSYLILCINNSLILFGSMIVFVHLPAFAVINGLTKSQAAFLLSFVGIGNFFGRILSGMLANLPCFSDTGLHVQAFLVCGVVTAATPFMTNLIWLAGTSVLFGMFYGFLCTLVPQIIIKILDVPLLVSGYGYLMLFDGIGTLVGPLVAEALFDHSGDYGSSFYLAGTMLFFSSLLMFYPWWKLHKSNKTES